MGEVYRARDPRLGREVAIKVLPEAVATDPERLSRFEKEARAAGALNHPHIMTVYDVGSDAGTPYVVMELLEGETLGEVLVHRTPTVRQVLRWGMQVSQGLAAAHRQGIVHRDLKPENLFLTTDGRIKILDFGLAKLQSRGETKSETSTAASPTQPGVLLGTLAYMSPEQVRAEEVDQRSDLFSFGVVLYELLAREHPFRRKTASATLTAILEESPRDLSTRQAGIPPGVERIVEQCLAKKREERFQSAHDLALALEGVLQERSGMAALLEVEERSPYPGLSSFTEEDTRNFLGREAEVKALWANLRGRRFLAVIGASGAGKTSFVRAGVVASRPDGWAAIVSTPGTAPLRGLGQALGPELAGDPEALRKLAGFEDPETAFELLTRWRRSHEEALIVLDQFEELFTLNASETQTIFAALIGRLGEADIHVLLSLRDDFLMRCHDHTALAPVFGELTPLGPLTREGLRRAVVEPAGKQGYRFEDQALVEEILSAVEGARGALPLLAFAVSRLWERRDREKKFLTREAYRNIGGVEGALAQHAEATLEQIGPEREGTMRSIFLNLTTAQGTRAALDREELLSALPDRDVAESVLRQLVEARLITSYEMARGLGEPSGHRVEILHESLLTAWPRLVWWQTQNADGAQLRDQLRQAAHLWQERGGTDDLLWTGASYLDYRAWRERRPELLSSVEEDFAQAMAALANRKSRRRWIAVAAIVAALTLGLGAYLFAQARSAARFTFMEKAQRLHVAVSERLLLPQENLSALSAFLEAAGQTSRRQFRMLAEPMLRRNRLVYAFEWLPFVRESERAAYEAEARASGLTDYRFWEIGPEGKPRESGRRSYYVPAHYMEPPVAGALGFDIATVPSSWHLVEEARDSGRITASRPFGLVEEAGKPDALPVVAMYAPVYRGGDPASDSARRAALAGFTMAIFRVAPLVSTAVGTVDASGLGLVLRDPEARDAPPLAERPKDAAALPQRVGFVLEFPVWFADRQWALTVFTLPAAFLPPKHGPTGIGSASVLAAVLGFSAVTLLRTISRRRRRKPNQISAASHR